MATTHRRPLRFASPLEAAFWDAWHARHGATLACQHRVGRWRCDFAHPATRVAVECDGASWHRDPESRAYDAARDAELRALGWEVVRLTGEEIRRDVAGCAARVGAAIAARRRAGACAG